MDRRMRNRGSRSWMVFAVAVVLLALIGCALCWAVYQFAQRDVRNASGGNQVTLEVAYSPEKQALFEELVKRYNASRPRTPGNKRITVVASAVEPETMMEAALAGQFQVICPDSSVWLTQLDLDWQAQQQAEAALVGETTRFAVSPVVIAMWEDTARSLGYPNKAIGWALRQHTRVDPDGVRELKTV